MEKEYPTIARLGNDAKLTLIGSNVGYATYRYQPVPEWPNNVIIFKARWFNQSLRIIGYDDPDINGRELVEWRESGPDPLIPDICNICCAEWIDDKCSNPNCESVIENEWPGLIQ